ncbi:hypothetical protein [Nocardioides bizhenqiangii]|uniref:Uncharacterized protein n=1 Tax=Nocardioides bizhenqiangii TaxID=3095076 RepID=A0ABZ0ZSY9_9ACTN|nr:MULTISPECIES: hypothetical protein [unclassified Nocardioides]MDZ5622757.1 hypothetical protein [Nocardioides sp. HM23]WQQ27019.1 hypothetical protein SHK19_02030 [Nocardioides sp. HM61]
MNRLIVVLLSVLIVLVAVHGFLVWRAGEQAHDDAEQAREYAEHQACVSGTQATVTVGLIAPALITPGEGLDRESQLESVRALSAQLDGC